MRTVLALALLSCVIIGGMATSAMSIWWCSAAVDATIAELHGRGAVDVNSLNAAATNAGYENWAGMLFGGTVNRAVLAVCGVVVVVSAASFFAGWYIRGLVRRMAQT